MEAESLIPTTPMELYATVLRGFNEDIHPIYQSVLEECCKAAFTPSVPYTDLTDMTRAVLVAFASASAILRAAMRDQGDSVSLHFRGEDFVFPKGSAILSN